MSRMLSAGATEVWFLPVDEQRDSIPEAQLAWLTPDESARASRFRFARDRRLYLASHVLLRGLLSQYVDLAPPAWRFEVDARGKPSVVNAGVTAPPFSLTHTRGLVCCAISATGAVGVDAEALDRPVDSTMWDQCCSPSERLDLEARIEPDRQRRFLAYWTLKESLSKAVGCGLTRDVSRLSFQIGGDGISVALGAPWDDDDDASEWQFGLFHVRPAYTVGVSVSAGPRVDVPIRLHEASLARLQ